MSNSAHGGKEKTAPLLLLRADLWVYSGMNEEISFQFTGNPPEIFKKMLFDIVKEKMKDIKKDVLENNGFIMIDYISDNDINLRAVSTNP